MPERVLQERGGVFEFDDFTDAFGARCRSTAATA
jgi:hypothetical protein